MTSIIVPKRTAEAHASFEGWSLAVAIISPDRLPSMSEPLMYSVSAIASSVMEEVKPVVDSNIRDYLAEQEGIGELFVGDHATFVMSGTSYTIKATFRPNSEPKSMNSLMVELIREFVVQPVIIETTAKLTHLLAGMHRNRIKAELRKIKTIHAGVAEGFVLPRGSKIEQHLIAMRTKRAGNVN